MVKEKSTFLHDPIGMFDFISLLQFQDSLHQDIFQHQGSKIDSFFSNNIKCYKFEFCEIWQSKNFIYMNINALFNIK